MADVTTNSNLDSGSTMMTETVTPTMWFNESGVTSTGTGPREEFSITESVPNWIDVKQPFHREPSDTLSVFEAFIIIEIVMTALELTISIVAVIKIPRWRKNYRNQMLMQFTVVRFFKRLVFLIIFLSNNGVISKSKELNNTFNFFEIYIDFVIAILVFFFIRHMYDSLIVVLVKISENNLCKVLAWAWLLPLPISTACTAIIATDVLDEWSMYLLTCCLFRWPLMLLGTGLYFTIMYRVMFDKKRRFVRSLTIITFCMCLMINFYLFSRDVIELWCLKSEFVTRLVSSISGMLMNLLILALYVVLIIMNFKTNNKSSNSVPNHSISIED